MTKVQSKDIDNKAFLTTGTAPAFEVAIPREAAYADMDRQKITINLHASASAAITINVNWLGAKALVDNTGTAITSATADDYLDLIYDLSQDSFIGSAVGVSSTGWGLSWNYEISHWDEYSYLEALTESTEWNSSFVKKKEFTIGDFRDKNGNTYPYPLKLSAVMELKHWDYWEASQASVRVNGISVGTVTVALQTYQKRSRNITVNEWDVVSIRLRDAGSGTASMKNAALRYMLKFTGTNDWVVDLNL